MLQYFLVGQNLDEEFEFVLLFEVFKGAGSNLFADCYLLLEVVDRLQEKLLNLAGFVQYLRVERRQLPILPLQAHQLPLETLQLHTLHLHRLLTAVRNRADRQELIVHFG